MPSFLDRVRGFFNPTIEQRSPRVNPGGGGSLASGAGRGVLEPRRGARTLRNFSETNPWVRTAINHRKRAIAKAKWSIVRIDDPKASPDPRIVKEATDLFTTVNDTRVNLNWLLSMLVEDILVVDAGVIEKELTHEGKIAALWPIAGEEIAPNGNWDGSHPEWPRYFHFRDGKLLATYKNDEMTYMMVNPRTTTPVGFSPVEALFDTIDAELYAAKMEARLSRETVPAGIIYMGSGVPPEVVESFRDQWENDISAQRGVAFFGGGDDPLSGAKSSAPEFIPFRKSAKDEDRRAYIKWLVTKIAACFEIDLLVFNLSETVNKSVGSNLTAKTDAGLLALADTIAQFITREILWVIDPTHRHGFEFLDLTPRDQVEEAKHDQALMTMGAITPNEVRAKRGMDPYPGSVGDVSHWANNPYPFQENVKLGPAKDVIPGEEPAKPDPDNEQSASDKNEPKDDDESGKTGEETT